MGYLFHSQSGLKARVIPYKGDLSSQQIDRLQTLDPDSTLNADKVQELGTSGIVDWLEDVPSVTVRATQREYGTLDFYNDLSNQARTNTSVSLGDFENSAFDVAEYVSDNEDTHRGTIWYPKLRLAGFSVNIGDPTAIIDRSFDFVGEDAILWQGDNKYLIYKKNTVASGDIGSADSVTITVSDPSAVQDPQDSVYILRVVRVRSGESTELTNGTDYSYSAGTLSVNSCQTSDVIKYWYTASSYISGSSVFTTNTSDLGAIRAHSAELYLYVGTSARLYKVQSATIDARLTRDDVREVGNEDVVLRGVSDKPVTITLGKLLDSDFGLEETLVNQSDGYGKIDVKEFSSDVVFITKLYDNADHDTFKLGYKSTGLRPTGYRPGAGAIDAHIDSGVTLESENLTITSNEGSL